MISRRERCSNLLCACLSQDVTDPIAKVTRYIFCDEFGNTGPHLLGTVQPVLLYAFVVWPEGALTDLAREIQRLYEQEGLKVGELKSSTLQGSARGRARYERIGHIASEYGARAFMSIVEKRYQVCVMILETYLDPELNDWAPRELYVPRFRQRFADACYEQLTDAVLAEFLGAVRSDDPKLIGQVGERLSTTLQFHPDAFVSQAARRMETRPDSVFRYSETRPKLPKNSDLPASQYAAFYPGLELVDSYLEEIGEAGTLIRDEDLQFGEVLDLAFARSQAEGGEAYRRRQRLTHLGGCASAKSAKEVGVQLADLVAGIFGRAATQAVLQKSRPKALAQVAAAWRGTLAPANQHYLMLADAVLPRVAHAVFDVET